MCTCGYTHTYPSHICSRFFLTRIQSDSHADIRIKPLDTQLWRRVPTPWVTDLPVLHGAQSELDVRGGGEVAYEVEVYSNVEACPGSKNCSMFLCAHVCRTWLSLVCKVLMNRILGSRLSVDCSGDE